MDPRFQAWLLIWRLCSSHHSVIPEFNKDVHSTYLEPGPGLDAVGVDMGC